MRTVSPLRRIRFPAATTPGQLRAAKQRAARRAAKARMKAATIVQMPTYSRGMAARLTATCRR